MDDKNEFQSMTYKNTKFEEYIRNIISDSNCNELAPQLYEIVIKKENKKSHDTLRSILKEIFHKNHSEVADLIRTLEKTGKIKFGLYTKDVAETITLSANKCAFENGQYVNISMQKDGK
jgi:ATP-dependent Clp protease adapter protein ClpS